MDNPAYIIDCDPDSATAKSKSSESVPVPEPVVAHTFEEAIALTGVGWYHYKLLLICGLCFMAVMTEIMGVSLIMPVMRCDLTPTVAEQGILASSGFLGVVLSSHAVGFLADTWGRVVTLRWSLSLAAVCSILSGFSVHIWMLIVLRFFTGFFISGGQACVFSLCGEFHSLKSRVRHVTLLSGFLCMAMVFAPSMAIGILPLRIDTMVLGMKFSSWRVLLLADVSITLLALAGLFTLPETPKHQLVQGNSAAALDTMRTMYKVNTGKDRDEFPVQQLALQTGGVSLSSVHGFSDALKLIWQQTVPLFYRSRVLHTLNICITQFLIYGIAQGIFMWFPTILNELNNGSTRLCNVLQDLDMADSENACDLEVDTNTYLVMIVIGAVFILIFIFFAYTIDYVGKRQLLFCWMAIASICLIGLNWLESYALVVIALTLVMAVGNCGGLVSTIAMEFYPTHINAMGMCFIMMIGRLGAVVGSNVLGNLLFSSCDTVLWIILGLLVALCIMCWFLPEQRHPKKQQQSKNERPSLQLNQKSVSSK